MEGRKELTKTQLRDLLDKATNYISRHRMKPLKWFYRNKPIAYFNEIEENHGNLMAKYMKDINGDPGSPINGELEGLFFGVCVGKNDGQPYGRSDFGPKRLLIPAEVMFRRFPNLYFTDFYCNYRSHYVTLVMTQNYSSADQFCRRKLVPLDLANNPFVQFRESQESPEMKVICDDLWVEILCTEDIDIGEVIRAHGAKFEMTAWSSITLHGGKPKNPNCTICNV